MKELKFFAADDFRVPHPRRSNDSARYIGFDATGAKLSKPDVINDDGSARVEALVNEVRRDKCLAPADEYTSKRVGIPLAKSAPATAPKADK